MCGCDASSLMSAKAAWCFSVAWSIHTMQTPTHRRGNVGHRFSIAWCAAGPQPHSTFSVCRSSFPRPVPPRHGAHLKHQIVPVDPVQPPAASRNGGMVNREHRRSSVACGCPPCIVQCSPSGRRCRCGRWGRGAGGERTRRRGGGARPRCWGALRAGAGGAAGRSARGGGDVGLGLVQ
jgi:hypothetical protein